MAIPENPITRKERYLAKAAGENVNTPDPITRKEHFLAKAAGENVNTPDPITREEMYLDAIASGSGGGGAPVLRDITINNNRTVGAATAKRVSVYGLYNSDNGKVYHSSVAGNRTISRKVVVSGPNIEGTGDENSTILVLSAPANASPIVVQSDSTNIFRQANFSVEGIALQYHVIMFDDSTDQITLNIG